jgi:hypothetical protein
MCIPVTPHNVEELSAGGVLPPFCGYVRKLNGKPPASKAEYKKPLTPFDEGPEALKSAYLRDRKVWLMKVETE